MLGCEGPRGNGKTMRCECLKLHGRVLPQSHWRRGNLVLKVTLGGQLQMASGQPAVMCCGLLFVKRLIFVVFTYHVQPGCQEYEVSLRRYHQIGEDNGLVRGAQSREMGRKPSQRSLAAFITEVQILESRLEKVSLVAYSYIPGSIAVQEFQEGAVQVPLST